MIHFNADDLTSKQQYKFITGSVIPRPIAWITTLSKDGKVVNAAPFSFFSAASNELPLLTVAVIRKSGEMKDTARNILDWKEAVVHIVDQAVIDEMNKTSASLPANESEIEMTNLTLVNSRTVSVPAIKEAKIRFEGLLHQHVPIENDDGSILSDLFLIRVTDFFFDDAVFDSEREYISSEALDPVARLSGNQYATLNRKFTLVRPDSELK